MVYLIRGVQVEEKPRAEESNLYADIGPGVNMCGNLKFIFVAGSPGVILGAVTCHNHPVRHPG